MKPIKFKTLDDAQAAYARYIAKTYKNVFQDAQSVARVNIVERVGYWCIQLNNYGGYLAHDRQAGFAK